MAPIQPWYSIRRQDRKVYHDDDQCPQAGEIDVKYRKNGRRARRRCPSCAKLQTLSREAERVARLRPTDHAQPATGPSVRQTSTMQKTGTVWTVLVVEDDEPLLTLLARTLESEGFRVLKAENGEVALQILGGLSRPPDIVLTDLAMPRMDGLEFAQVLSSQDPSVPIIFMSGAPLFIAGGLTPQLTNGIPLLDAKARLLLKPFSPGVLLEAITGALAREQHSRQTPA